MKTLLVVCALTIVILLITLVLLFTLEGYHDNVIDLPEVDYYNFECGSYNVRFRTTNYLTELTNQEIVTSGGSQSDIDRP